jgi:uncharacterized protein YjbI with pentapeptide repeats
MAAKDQVELLRSGWRNWNKWRETYPHAMPELDGAILNGIDLKGADLKFANLSEADLGNSNLASVNLRDAKLFRASFEQATLSNANLENVDARFANFHGAVMTRANLCLANLQGADMRGATLEGTEFGQTGLADVSLAEAKNLETCRFLGPVAIDFRTITRSGHLPAPFLRGCGVPEELIENLPALFLKPVQSYSLFIQSCDPDKAFAERIHADLEARGIRCWTVKGASSTIASQTFEAIQEQSLQTGDSSVLLVLSRHCEDQSWVERDARISMRNERLYSRKLLHTIRLDKNSLGLAHSVESVLNERAIDFSRWKERTPYAKALESLVASLSS